MYFKQKIKNTRPSTLKYHFTNRSEEVIEVRTNFFKSIISISSGLDMTKLSKNQFDNLNQLCISISLLSHICVDFFIVSHVFLKLLNRI